MQAPSRLPLWAGNCKARGVPAQKEGMTERAQG